MAEVSNSALLAQQKVLLHDLARAMFFDATESEKISNKVAQDVMSGSSQDQLIQDIYKR